jgi:hypothetical protein
MSLLDMVQQHLGQGEIEQISRQIGAEPTQTRRAVDAAVPMLVGGMASTAQQPGGLDAIQQALGSHGGGLLGGLGGLLGGASAGGASALGGGALGGVLGSILGGHHETVQQGVQQASGLNSDQVRRLLMILAPIVMGVLARRKQQQGLTPTQLGTELQQNQQQIQQQATQGGGMLGGMLGQIFGR